MENQNLHEKIKLNKQGSIRSLALSSIKVFMEMKFKEDQATEKAWKFAKLTQEKFGDGFTEENAQQVFKTNFGSQKIESSTTKPVSTRVIPVGKIITELTDDQVNMVEDQSIPKNTKIRELFAANISVSVIATSLGITYQRAKNTIKNDKKKADKVEMETANV